MITILTHMYRVRAIFALLLFLSSASLWAQSDDATLINITTLTQLDAIRYDLDGDGTPSGSTSERTAYRTAFGLTGSDNNICIGGCSGYELMNNLDFEDANGDGTADDKSIWAEGATAAGVSGAVAEGWAPIGDNSTDSDATRFTATFDGRGHTISNLYINRPSTNYVGLFGVLWTGSNARNLGIEGSSVSGADYVGGLVGSNFNGPISACYATGDASGTNRVGGLVGENKGPISACYATGDATGTENNVGGLVGNNEGTISACYATGNASARFYVGGLVGYNEGTISACYATGNATGTGSSVGGLVGYNEGTISACYATGNANGASDVGGLVGRSEGPISACYATGNASGGFSGGLVGENSGTVTNSYFDSSISNRLSSDPYAKTTAELQTPTAYGTAMDIYANWNIDVDDGLDVGVDNGTAVGDSGTDNPWDFGTDMQYPALQVDFDRDGTASVAEFGNQPRAVLFRVSSFTPTSGVVGATVTIRGNLFSGTATDNTVVFLGAEGDETDDVVATVSAATTSSLTVTVPPDAKTGKISVMVGSAADTSAASFTVRVPSVVSSFTPEMGVVGTRVTITGAGFSTSLRENTVTFLGDINDEADNQQATVSASTASSLTVSVPTDAKTGKISVMVGSAADTSDASFTVTFVVSSFTPEMGVVGTRVTITGAGFSTSLRENTVTFLGDINDEADNQQATVSASTASSLTVSVPTDAKTGKISVMVGTTADTSDASFTVTAPAPVVSNFTPTSGAVGATVMITGTGFSTTAGENTVTFLGAEGDDNDNVVATASTSPAPTASSLTVSVPTDAKTGKISVMVGSAADTSDASFTVTPVVSSFTPEMGVVGATVTIRGRAFSATATDNTVVFLGAEGDNADNAAATVSAATASSLTVTVPPDAKTGKISVMVGTTADTSDASFTVPPVVSSFTPEMGVVGTRVTITGAGFSTSLGENIVTFLGDIDDEADNQRGTVFASTATSLTVRVTTAAKTGKISVMVGTTADTSDASFTVTGTTPEPAAFSVPLSSEGDVRVYPNPTSGQLHFKGLLAGGRYVCDLYSLVGQKVLSSVVRAGDTMDTSTLSSGQYILILQAEGRDLMRTRLLVVR